MKLDKIIAVRTGKTVYKDGDRVIKVFENGYSMTNGALTFLKLSME